jgi:hypothetical protein
MPLKSEDFRRIREYIAFKLREKISSGPAGHLKNDLTGGFEGIGKDSYEKAALNFSGGPNSLLAAALLTQYVSRIHLLAYTRSFMKHTERMKIPREMLAGKFGAERFIYREKNIDGIVKETVLNEYEQDRKEFGPVMYMMKTCAGCKLGMHLATIRYCLERGIRLVCDGSNQSGAILIPDQNREVVEVLKALYRHYGIIYLVPVYEVYRSDWECFRMGITEKKGLKTESLFYSSQPSCGWVGLYMHLYVLGYYLPRHGLIHYVSSAVRYHREKLPAFYAAIEKMKDS